MKSKRRVLWEWGLVGLLALAVAATIGALLLPADTNAKVFPEGFLGFRVPAREIVVADQAIEGISQANPGVVTITGHNLDDGHEVYISGVVGMTEVNDAFYTVTVLTVDTFSIGVDTTAFTAYTSDGTAAGGLIQIPDTYTGQYFSLINGSSLHASTVPVYLSFGVGDAVPLPTISDPSRFDYLDPGESADIPAALTHIRLNVASGEKVWIRYRPIY